MLVSWVSRDGVEGFFGTAYAVGRRAVDGGYIVMQRPGRLLDPDSGREGVWILYMAGCRPVIMAEEEVRGISDFGNSIVGELHSMKT